MTDITETMAQRIASLTAEHGGTAYYVGGYVRDTLRGLAVTDMDLEIHGVTPAVLEGILDSVGERIAVGESFGIYTLKGCSLDIAMPRREENRGHGHRDFDICVDPFLGTENAARRRDFTVNALLQNVLTGEILDPFHGREDMNAGILRHVDSRSFGEDPLRVLRGAQFAARFGYTVAEDTLRLCSSMDLTGLAKERVMGELEKALLQAPTPSVFFDVLRRTGQLSGWFPEAEALIGVPQSPVHHTEGDVWAHTMLVLDKAATLRHRAADPLGFMLAALTHDFGKPLCTETESGKFHAYGHETLGLPRIETFLRRLTEDRSRLAYVLNLCEYHMKPAILAASASSIKATNRLFDASADPEGLICLALADGMGSLPAKGGYVSPERFLEERLAVYRDYMARPYVMGRDLITAGLPPSPHFSEYLALAHKLRLAGVEKENALKQVLAAARANS